MSQGDSLVSQTDTEDGNSRFGNHLGADPEVVGLVRRPRPRGDHHIVELLEGTDAPVLPVIAHDDGWAAVDLGEVVVQVVGERVVVVDEQRAYH